MTLKFKPAPPEPMFTTEPHYDLFDGGYISPSAMLEEKDAARVRSAVDLVEEFLSEAERNGHLEVG